MVDIKSGKPIKTLTRREFAKLATITMGFGAIPGNSPAYSPTARQRGLTMRMEMIGGGGTWTPDDRAWIGLTGTQMWDLGENVTADMKVEIKFMSQSGTSNTVAIGLWDNTTGMTNRFLIQRNNNSINAYFGNTLTSATFHVSDGVYYVISLSSGVCKLDATTKTVGTTIDQPLNSPYVGCYHAVFAEGTEEVNSPAIGRYRYVKCWKGNVLVRDFRPRLYSDGWKPFDLVSQTPFPNLGTGAFTGGVDVG